MDSWMDDMRLHVLFNRVSIISERCYGDNERLCAMQPCLRFEKFPSQAGLEPGTAGSVGQR